MGPYGSFDLWLCLPVEESIVGVGGCRLHIVDVGHYVGVIFVVFLNSLLSLSRMRHVLMCNEYVDTSK